MFKKIIDKIEKMVIAYETRRIPPHRTEYYMPNGIMYRENDSTFDSKSRYFYNEKGQEVGYVHLRDGKVTYCTSSEYKDDGKLKKIHRREFTVINNERILKSDHITIFNDDKSYTIFENGIKTEVPAEKHTEVKDERGNVVQSTTIYPDERGTFYVNSVFDKNNNQLQHEYIQKIGNKAKMIHRDFNEYDEKNRRIKHIFYMKDSDRTTESVSLTYYTYDNKNRNIYYREYRNFYYPHTGKQSSTMDSYYRYDDKNNAVINYDDHKIWDYKTYKKTTVLPDGRKIEQNWTLPTWIDKVRKFFNAL